MDPCNCHNKFYYPDPGGCSLCDARNDLQQVAQEGTNVPWSSKDYDELEAVQLIRHIKTLLGKPSERERYGQLVELGL